MRKACIWCIQINNRFNIQISPLFLLSRFIQLLSHLSFWYFKRKRMFSAKRILTHFDSHHWTKWFWVPAFPNQCSFFSKFNFQMNQNPKMCAFLKLSVSVQYSRTIFSKMKNFFYVNAKTKWFGMAFAFHLKAYFLQSVLLPV